MTDIYRSQHKGSQIDEAVETVLDNDCLIKWGNVISGELSAQTDLWAALNTKALKSTMINGHSLNGDITLVPSDIGAQAEITGAASTITTNNLTTNRALISNSSGKVDVSTVTNTELATLHGITATTTELNYTDGVTSNIQTQLDSKQPNITGAASTITSNFLSPSMALVSDSNGRVAVSNNITSTELGYLDGVTSNIQTQFNGGYRLARDIINLGTTSGTVSLTNNSVHLIALNGDVTFSLPSPSSASQFNQMVVLLNMSTVRSITPGTTHYFTGVAPAMGWAGNYTVIYEHNGSYWFVGALYKGN